MQQKTAGALWEFAAVSQANTDTIIAADSVPQLAALIRSDQPAVQQERSGRQVSAQQRCHHYSRLCASAHCFVEVRQASCIGPSSKRHEHTRPECSAQQRCHHCGRHFTSNCCLVEVTPASCASSSSSSSSSRLFAKFCTYLPAEHRCHHCSGCCASACCFAADGGSHLCSTKQQARWGTLQLALSTESMP